MLRVIVISMVMAFGCAKSEPKPQSKPPATITTGAIVDGVRRIEIEANTSGYTPERIPGKPGEKLMLVFTRTADAQCIAQLKTPDGKLIDLPQGKPVEVAVTVPQTGEVGFACGMDMFHGVIVAQPAT